MIGALAGPPAAGAWTYTPRPPNIVALGHVLQRQDFQVGQHPAFGGVCACHVPGSKHYTGHAIDVNHDQGSERYWLSRLAIRLRDFGWTVFWQTAGHFDHEHVEY